MCAGRWFSVERRNLNGNGVHGCARPLLLVTLLIFPLINSCATTTKEKIIQNMLIAGGIGAAVGQTRSEFKNTYSTMYASSGAAIAGGISAYYYASKDEDLKAENDNMKARLDQFQKRLQPQLIQSGNSLFSSPLPKEMAGLVEPGEWKRYKMDQWVQDQNQSNTWYRQVEMFEIIPPVSK